MDDNGHDHDWMDLTPTPSAESIRWCRTCGSVMLFDALGFRLLTVQAFATPQEVNHG